MSITTAIDYARIAESLTSRQILDLLLLKDKQADELETLRARVKEQDDLIADFRRGAMAAQLAADVVDKIHEERREKLEAAEAKLEAELVEYNAYAEAAAEVCSPDLFEEINAEFNLRMEVIKERGR